jgi:hypothetical protein
MFALDVVELYAEFVDLVTELQFFFLTFLETLEQLYTDLCLGFLEEFLESIDFGLEVDLFHGLGAHGKLEIDFILEDLYLIVELLDLGVLGEDPVCDDHVLLEQLIDFSPVAVVFLLEVIGPIFLNGLLDLF